MTRIERVQPLIERPRFRHPVHQHAPLLHRLDLDPRLRQVDPRLFPGRGLGPIACTHCPASFCVTKSKFSDSPGSFCPSTPIPLSSSHTATHAFARLHI